MTRKASRDLLAAAWLSLWSVPIAAGAQPPSPPAGQAAPLEAQFRGCQTAGWCRFRIEAIDTAPESLYRVRPDGIAPMPGDDALAVAVRDRLNALLASMIHQHKRIVLHDLCELADGTFAATVSVNGANVASDPILVDLQEKLAHTAR